MAWWPPRSWFRRDVRGKLVKTRDAYRGARAEYHREFGYKGAARSRRTYDLDAGSGSGNAELGAALPLLRQRSRQAMRDNGYALRALVTQASYLSGLMPRSAIPVPDGASDAERKRIELLNRVVDLTHTQWGRVCNARGRGNYRGFQFQVVLGALVAGDSFTRERIRRMSDGLPVPLQLELMEGDFCDHTKDEALDGGGWIRQGVEHSVIGRVVAYHLYRQHPGEVTIGIERAFETVRISADGIAHLFPELLGRPGQVRGEPWFHANIQSAHDFAEYLDAERVRMRAAASQMAVIKSEDTWTFPSEEATPEKAYGLNPIRDADGNVVERMKSGQFGYLQSGQEVEWSKPPTNEGFAQYVKTDLRGQAAGALQPYELYSGDLEKTNYSSIRFGLNSFNRFSGRGLNDCVLPLWCEPVWGWFIRAGIASGDLPEEAGPVTWEPEPVGALEPDREAKANSILVRHGAKSLYRWIRETGGDPDEVLRDMVTLKAWSDEHDIALDSLPWTTTLAGQTQEAFTVDPDESAE